MKIIPENRLVSASKKKKRQEPGGGEGDERKDEDAFMYNLNYIANRVHCDFCEKDITKHVRIICDSCHDMDICLNCFATAKEKGKHFRNHRYHVINKLNFPLVDGEWSAEEELLLLDGLERFGFGNWADIVEHIGTEKTKEEVVKHYDQYYMNSPKFVPPLDKVMTRRDPETKMLIFQQRPPKKEQIIEEVPPNIPPPPQPMAMENENSNQLKKRNPPTTTQTTGPSRVVGTSASNVGEGNASEIIGYMPLRGDFDVEYDNDAELLLAEMEFTDEDTPEEIELKFKVLDIYNARLDERLRRKRFVVERDLLDFKKQYMLDRTRTKEEKEIYNLMKVFARFNSPEEHEKLVQGIIKERKLRARIEELRHYRKIGLKTFEEVEQYLSEKRKKDDAYLKKQRQNENFVYELNNRYSVPLRRTRFKGEIFDKKNEGEKKKNPSSMLTELENKLCETLSLNAYEYLLIKDILVRECVKEGFVHRDFVSTTFSLDKDRVFAIFDFLVTNKMILERIKPPPNPTNTAPVAGTPREITQAK